MDKIAIFGGPGTGKTVLARELAARLDLPHTQLDEILFTPDGTLGLDEFRARAAAVTDGDRWIVEGNFAKLADVTWHRADVLVWLDYRLSLIMWRIVTRSLRQLTGREPDAQAERLTWRHAFFDRRSLLRTAIRKYRHNRPRYARQAEQTEALGVSVLRMHTPAQTRRWLTNMPGKPSQSDRWMSHRQQPGRPPVSETESSRAP